MKAILILLIRGYRILISPLFPPSCRFNPTCSQYALEAVERFGAFKGGWLAIKRILRCHPFHSGGYDPVPPLVMCHSDNLSSESDQEEDRTKKDLNNYD